MRPALVLLHRWLGLATALFLFVSGATGALISWDHELDEWLNPQLFHAKTNGGAPLPALELARRVEAADPRVRASFVPLEIEPGHALNLFVAPRIDPASGKPYAVDYNQLAVDPASGEIQGRRTWGAISLAPENLLSFLYKLHYTMHIPEGGGIEWGVWFVGLVGIVWFLDCIVALVISFPNRASWRKSFQFRRRRLNFDLHRSGGVWLWGLLLVIAFTSISMNLRNEVVRPLVSLFSPLAPSVFASRAPRPWIEARVTREQIVARARAEAQRRGWALPAGGVFESPEFGVYGVGFFTLENSHGDGTLGNPWLYYDSTSGEPVSEDVPGTGSAGDLFMQLQFPLHSGRILGIPGRILVSLLGAAVAALSVTGIVIWVRKRRARLHPSHPSTSASQPSVSRAVPDRKEMARAVYDSPAGAGLHAGAGAEQREPG